MIHIRQAEARDIPAISLLYHQLVHPIAPEVKVDLRRDRIEQIRADPQNFLFVLQANDRVGGTAFVTLCPDPMHGHQPYALVEHFVIGESMRGKGYGTMLAAYLENFCLQADCSQIMLLSNSKRSEAHRFFEKQGFSSERKKGFVKYRSQLRSA
jgi:N-acetylglutamate synthase-like GNAT family acetyltransferase